jgi:alpha-tubulin suppressor-like RCC1 family protein
MMKHVLFLLTLLPTRAHAGSLAACEFATCEVTADKRVACWGLGSDRERYPPDIVRSRTPKLIAGLSQVTDVACRYRYACATTARGEVKCWGMLLMEPEKSQPLATIAVKDVVETVVLRYAACVRTRSGDVYCWGELKEPGVAKPVQKVASGATRLFAGEGSLCVQDREGTLRCTGTFVTGAIGELLGQWKSLFDGEKVVSVGGEHTPAAVTADGEIRWGENDNHYAELTSGIHDAVRVWASADFGCALTKTGELRCWGRSYAAQLGDGVVESKARSAVKAQVPEPVIDAAIGSVGACARTRSKRVYCWGANDEWTAGGSEPRVLLPRLIK